MSISILNRGASGGLKPELIVTAPSGSTIDLIQNSIIVATYTLGAEETEHTFVVRLGTYTVRGTLGTDTSETEVVVDAVRQYAVEIEYALWLYNYGDLNADVLGGYSVDQAIVNFNADNIYIQRNHLGRNGVYFTNAIDFTKYTALKVVADADIRNSNSGINFSVMPAANVTDTPVAGTDGWGTDASHPTFIQTKGVAVTDVSAVSGNYYFSIFFNYSTSDSYGDNVTVYQVWLE